MYSETYWHGEEEQYPTLTDDQLVGTGWSLDLLAKQGGARGRTKVNEINVRFRKITNCLG